MPTYIDEDELLADTGQTDVSKAPPGAIYIDESELGLEGRPAAQKSLGGQILDFVTDPEELKTYGKSLVSLGTAAADLILGIPGQGARVASDIYERGKGLVTGRSRAETEAAVQEAKGMVPEAWSSPLQSLARMGGVEPWNQEIVGRTLERGAKFVGEHSGGLLTKTDAESLLETAMLGGVTHVPRQAVKQAMAPRQRLGAENRATYAPEAVEPPAPFEPRGIADRGRTPVPPTPEEAIARSQKNIKAARKAFADKEAVAQMEELANARQIKVGEALMGDETVQVTGEARRGADGKLYTPVIRGGTQMEVPSSDLAPKPQVGLEHLISKAPEFEAPTRELGTGRRLPEGTVLGEPPSPLATALEKVRAGQAFRLAADERIAMRSLEKASGNIVGLDGKPLPRQAGAIDPRLLGALGIASGATLLALNPEYLEKLGTVGLIGATMLGSDRSIGALKQRAAPYSFALLDDVPQGKIEFNRQEILDRLKRPNISAQEKAVVERVLGDKQRITSEELVGGMLEETANWKLTPERTQQYADYGLGQIGRQAGKFVTEYDPRPVAKDNVTTKYRLPEHMQVTDANHFSDDRLFGWTRSFKEDGVRHVVELQSDLAQKTRGALSPEKLQEAYARMDDITGRMMQLKQEMGKATDPAENLGRRKEFVDLVKEREGLQEAVQATSIESQLSPILKNWPRRLIREELAQAAQAGEGNVRFASADTVAKVEGWPDAHAAARANLAEPPGQFADLTALRRGQAEEILKGPRFDPGHQRIYDRYAGEITRYLKGLGGKEVTDAQGHTWIEVPTAAVETPFGPRVKMLGRADPALLVAGGAITAGAAIGALTSTEHPLRNAIYGALAGGALGTAKGRSALQAAIKSPDKALGAISTRLGNISPALKTSLRNHELAVLKGIEHVNNAALPFIQALQDLPKDVAARVERGLLNGDLSVLKATPELAKTYPAVRRILGELEQSLRGLGRFSEGVTNYFPRIVKDFEGLKNALGQEAAQGLEKALIDAEAKMIRKEGRSLTDIEQSVIANRYLFAPDQGSFQPGYTKARKIQEVTPELQQFYERPTESLLRYLSGAITDVETAKFFGRDLATKKQGKGVYTDLDSSIGNLTARLMKDKRISREQAAELRDILKARFEGGAKGMSQPLAITRNLTNTALLGNIASAATQIGDSLLTIYHQGLVPTLQAVTQKVLGKERVTPKDLGLINHIAEELSEMGLTGRVLHNAMKYSGFHAVDMFAKGLMLNASLNKNTKLVRTPQGEAEFRARYGEAFGPETEQLIADLKAGRRSDVVDQLIFSELSDAQPVSKAEMPEMYLANPNGRFLYQLKTYMLKQADVVRRDAYQQIAKGTPEGIKKGTKALAGLATVYALANVPGDVVKDFISGRPVDPLSTPRLVENVLQTFGINRYAGEQIGQGKVVETLTGMATPPLRVLQDIAQGKPKAVGYIPLVGRPLADRYFGGNERREIYEKRLENRGKPAAERVPLSPRAKAYVRQRNLENLEKARKAKALQQ